MVVLVCGCFVVVYFVGNVCVGFFFVWLFGFIYCSLLCVGIVMMYYVVGLVLIVCCVYM